MILLAIAISGPCAEVGVLLPDGEFAAHPAGEGMRRGRDIGVAVRDLLATRALVTQQLEAVAVDIGPGSFTGVRVGVTFATPLAWAIKCRVAPVISLEALAAAAQAPGPVLVLRDAGRGRLYAAGYGARRAGRPQLLAPARMEAQQVRMLLPTAVRVAEDPRWLAAAAGTGEVAQVGARVVADVGRRVLDASPGIEAHQLVPAYLQASTPEQRLRGEA